MSRNRGRGFGKKEVIDLGTETGVRDAMNLAKSAQSSDPELQKFAQGVQAATGIELPATFSIQDSLDASSPTSVQSNEGSSAPTTTQESASESREAPISDNGAEAGGQPASPTLTLDAVRGLVESAVGPLREQVSAAQGTEAQLREQLEQLQGELARSQQAAQQSEQRANQFEQQAQALNDLNQLIGRSDAPGAQGVAPVNFNTRSSINDEPKGFAAELVRAIESEQSYMVRDARSGLVVAQRDPQSAARVIQASFMEAALAKRSWRQSGVIREIEEWGKRLGYLSGITRAAGPTSGAAGSAPDLFIDTLSAIIRETHNTMNVFWQFAITTFDPSTAPGKNALIPRWNYIGEPTSLSDYELASYNSYTPVGQTIGTDTDSQGLEQSSVPVNILQYGLGKNASVDTRPVFISEFHEAIALLSLIDALDSRLMQNYYKFEDLLVRVRYEASTKILYNNGGTATANASEVVSGSGAIYNKRFAHSMYSYLLSRAVPTFADGCYVQVLNPSASEQFQVDLENDYRPVTTEQMEKVTNMFAMSHGLIIGRMTGYLGCYCGFHTFLSNTIGVGDAGLRPTTQNTTFGAGVGSQLTGDSFVFGPGAVGRGVGLPVEIRPSGTVPFGLGESYIWLSREGSATIDTDVAINASQQTRVWKARTTRVEV
ncbi:MAG: hypothetical protein AAFY20_09340 [Cyanobacteria bacterium J06639_14]